VGIGDTDGLFNKVDWVRGMLITVALCILLFSLAERNIFGWKAWIPTLIVISTILAAAFVAWQRYLEKMAARSPLVKISLFSNGPLQYGHDLDVFGLCVFQ
jgi:drug/metabolite transporter (DMT)-like permease